MRSLRNANNINKWFCLILQIWWQTNPIHYFFLISFTISSTPSSSHLCLSFVQFPLPVSKLRRNLTIPIGPRAFARIRKPFLLRLCSYSTSQNCRKSHLPDSIIFFKASDTLLTNSSASCNISSASSFLAL